MMVQTQKKGGKPVDKKLKTDQKPSLEKEAAKTNLPAQIQSPKNNVQKLF